MSTSSSSQYPGTKKDEIELQILNNTLLISANIEEKEDAKYIRQEFRKASFERSFKLGESVDQEQISAHYNAGILLIKLNKKEDQKPRTIKLKD